MDEMNDFLETLCGNHKIYENILLWLKNFNYNTRISVESCIIVSGFNCTGKSYSIKKICEYLKYHIINIDNHRCYNSSQLKDLIFKSATSSMMQVLANTCENKVIIIDNFDSMYIIDKGIISVLLKILTDKKLKNIPIICITSNDIYKKMGDIKKKCKTYEIIIPTQDEVLLYFNKRDLNKNYIKGLYVKNEGNLERIFTDVENKEGGNNIYINELDKVQDINALYEHKFDREQVRKIVETDIHTIPLKIHDNIIKELENRKVSYQKTNQFYKLYMNIMCLYDFNMQKDNGMIGLELFVCIVYFLSILKYKKSNTKILNYLSIPKNNVNTLYNAEFPIYQISNYHINLCNRKFIYIY